MQENGSDSFYIKINHFNPKEMIKRINFPNPQKVQNMNYIQVASVEMFDKMFEELNKDEKNKLLNNLNQKYNLPFNTELGLPK